MTKIWCAENRCKHNKENRCTAKEINLSANSIMTLWEGRREFNTCNTFEESEESKEMQKAIEKFLKKEREDD